jgi:hypothetical protein
LWFEPTVSERTSITEAAVPPARADDVQVGHEVASLAEARRYVRNLQGDSESISTPTTTSAPPAEATPTSDTTPTSTP